MGIELLPSLYEASKVRWRLLSWREHDYVFVMSFVLLLFGFTSFEVCGALVFRFEVCGALVFR